MRVVVQRVAEAGVTVEGHAVGLIGRGLLVLAGFEADMQVRLVNDGPVTLFIDSRQPE